MPCDGSGTLLTDHQHALWIDRVVLPSIREVMPPASCQHLPLTWECVVAKVRANHKEHRTWDEGGQHAIHYAVQEKYLSQLWSHMLAKLTDPTPRDFCGMFIVIQMYGTKLVWNHPDFPELRRDFIEQLNHMVDLQHLNSRRHMSI
jgi:hypothetical protein